MLLNAYGGFGGGSQGDDSATDPYFSSVTSLLHFDTGNTTITDVKTRTWTATGNASANGTAKFGANSLALDGTGDYITTPYVTASFDWWTSDYTLEYWIYPRSTTGLQYWTNQVFAPTAIGNASATANTNYWSFGPLTDLTIRLVYWTGTGRTITSTQTISLNQWSHLALVKNASGVQIYVNGVGMASPVAIVGTPQSSTGVTLTMGQINNAAANTLIDDLRITKGVARYTTNFTPRTSAFPDS